MFHQNPQSKLQFCLALPCLVSITLKESLNVHIMFAGHCAITCIAIKYSTITDDQFLRHAQQFCRMDPFVFKSLCMDLNMLLLAHAVAMIFLLREDVFQVDFLITLLYYLIQNTILLIVMKNQMKLVCFTNLAIGFFNFLAQQTYNLIRLRILEEQSTKNILFRCASEMVLTSATQTLCLALMLMHFELTVEISNNMKEQILCNQFVKFLLHQPDNSEPWKAQSGDSDLKEHQQQLRTKTESRVLIAKYALREKYRKDIDENYLLSQRLSRTIINDHTLSPGPQDQTQENKELLLSIMFRGFGSDKNEEHLAKLKAGQFYSMKKVLNSFIPIDHKQNSVINDSQIALIEELIPELIEKVEAKQSLAVTFGNTSKRRLGIGQKGWLSTQKEMYFSENIRVILRCQISEQDNIVMMKCDQIFNPEKADKQVQPKYHDSPSFKQDQQAQTTISCMIGFAQDNSEENDTGNIQSVAFSDLVQQYQNKISDSPKNEKINQKFKKRGSEIKSLSELSISQHAIKCVFEGQQKSSPKGPSESQQYNSAEITLLDSNNSLQVLNLDKDNNKCDGQIEKNNKMQQEICVTLEILRENSQMNKYKTITSHGGSSNDYLGSHSNSDYWGNPKHQSNQQSIKSAIQRISNLMSDCYPKQKAFSNHQQYSSAESLKDQIYQNRMAELEKKINSNKIFMDMVIHDMRNPTSSIEFNLENAQVILQQHFETLKALKKTIKKNESQQEQEVPAIDEQSQSSSDEQIQEQPGDDSRTSPPRIQLRNQPQLQREPEQDLDGQQFESLEICDELDETANQVNIPKIADQINARNYKVMKDGEIANEPQIVDRIVFVGKSHINMIDRSIQVGPHVSEAASQVSIKKQFSLKKKKSSRQFKQSEILEKVLENNFEDRVLNLLENCMYSAKIITNLINDLLDSAKIQYSKLTFNNEYFNLNMAIKKAICQVQYLAQKKGISITTEFAEEQQISSLLEPVQPDFKILDNIYGDARRLIQILYNFLSNAIKFSNQNGTVTVAVRLVEEQEIVSELKRDALKSVIEQSISQQSQKKKEQSLIQIQEDPRLQNQLKNKQMLLINRSFQSVALQHCNQSYSLQNKNESLDQSVLKYVNDHSLQLQPKRSFEALDILEKMRRTSKQSACKQSQKNSHQESSRLLGSISEKIDSEIDMRSRANDKPWVLESCSNSNSEEAEKYIKFEIDIIDSGVGIKEENLDKLFMKFGMLDEHSKMNSQGTGLGLSICKSIVEQMGGSVGVKSKENVGSTFTITMLTKAKKVSNKKSSRLSALFDQQSSSNAYQPNSDSQGQSQKSPSAMPDKNVSLSSSEHQIVPRRESQYQSQSLFKQAREIKKFTCVIANDNQFQMMAAVYNLEALGVQVLKQAFNGLEALQYVQENWQTHIDFILLDLDMPIMSGFNACKSIKALYLEKTKQLSLEEKKVYENKIIQNNGGLHDSVPQSDQNEQADKLINELFNRPLLFAFSGLVNDQVEKSAQEHGFQVVMESPLTQQKIQKIIFTSLENRKISTQLARRVIQSGKLQEIQQFSSSPVDEDSSSQSGLESSMSQSLRERNIHNKNRQLYQIDEMKNDSRSISRSFVGCQNNAREPQQSLQIKDLDQMVQSEEQKDQNEYLHNRSP